MLGGSRHEARFVVDEALGADRTGLHAPVPACAAADARRMAARRAAGEPLQYVFGHWSFRHLDLLVDPRVLIPRPETEQVVEVALAEARRLAGEPPASGRRGLVAVDAGTGTGAIALALATALGRRVLREVWATDASADALAVAAANVAAVAGRAGEDGAGVELALGCWLAPLPARLGGAVDLVVSNPPYVSDDEWAALAPEVRAEPRRALVAGTRQRRHARTGRRGGGARRVEGVAGQARHRRGGAGAAPGRCGAAAGPGPGVRRGAGGARPGGSGAGARGTDGALTWQRSPRHRTRATWGARETAPARTGTAGGGAPPGGERPDGGGGRGVGGRRRHRGARGRWLLPRRARRDARGRGQAGAARRRPRGPALRGRPRRGPARADVRLDRRAGLVAGALLARPARGVRAAGRRGHAARRRGGSGPRPRRRRHRTRHRRVGGRRGHARRPGAPPAVPRERPLAHGAAELHRGGRGRPGVRRRRRGGGGRRRPPRRSPSPRWWTRRCRPSGCCARVRCRRTSSRGRCS